jgi:hypothetical protein
METIRPVRLKLRPAVIVGMTGDLPKRREVVRAPNSRQRRAGPIRTCVRSGPDDHRVPTVSRFYGITIQMFHKEHGVPHFHARYAGDAASLSIEDLTVLEGSLPPRAQRLVREWAEAHRTELLANWQRARAGEPLAQIKPLR